MLLLDVTGDHVLTLSSYSGHGSNYEKKMKALQLSALNDLLLLDQKQKNIIIDRLNEIKVQLDDAVTKIFDSLNKKKFNVREYEMLLNKYFMVPDFKASKFDDDFILDLSDAIAIKQGILEGFIYRITGDTKSDKNVKKKKISAPTFALFCFIVSQSGYIEYKGENYDIYIEKVLDHFKIKPENPTIESIRKKFSFNNINIKAEDTYLNRVIDDILPYIKDENKKIEKWINSIIKK